MSEKARARARERERESAHARAREQERDRERKARDEFVEGAIRCMFVYTESERKRER